MRCRPSNRFGDEKMDLGVNSSFDMRSSKELVNVGLEIIQRHANAGTDGRRIYSSDPFPTRNYKKVGG